MKKEIISFRKDIQPNETITLSERIKSNGLIEEIRVRFYPGLERSLQIRPYVLHDNRMTEDCFTYPEGTDKFLSGDDDYLIFPVSIQVELDDELKIWTFNNNLDYVYTLVIDVVISYDYEV